MDRVSELEQFKTEIDLRIVAAELGYGVNQKKSSRGSTAMDHASGDRILVALAPDGHYVYCSVHDPADAGSVIDLWQRRRGGSLGEVRKALRPFLGGPGFAPPPPPSGMLHTQMLPDLRPVERDILGVRARYEGFGPLGSRHSYLCGARGIPPELLALPRIHERIRMNAAGDAVFPHFDDEGLCGYETKGDGVQSFSKGGRKGIWCSVPEHTDLRAVISESAIDALSYGVIRGHERTRFLSFSGGMNGVQPGLLQKAMGRMPAGSVIVAAVDHDDAGGRYVSVLKDLFRELGREDLSFLEDRPSTPGEDWNDQLRGRGEPVPDRQPAP